MFLLVLSSNPVEAAMLVPKRYQHKQLLELMQMLSCVVNFGYEKLPNGKEIKKWIEKNPDWTYMYAKILMQNVNLTEETKIKYKCLIDLLNLKCPKRLCVPNATTAIFRYVKEYAEFTEYNSNSELPIDVAIEEYRKYIIKKEEWYNEKRKRNKRTNK